MFASIALTTPTISSFEPMMPKHVADAVFSEKQDK